MKDARLENGRRGMDHIEEGEPAKAGSPDNDLQDTDECCDDGGMTVQAGLPVIELRDVNKRYGKHIVLQGASFTVRAGEICCLTGRNGAGKTTTLRIILGLTGMESGSLSLFGSGASAGSHLLSAGKLRRERRRIGFFVGATFFDYMTGRQNLKYYAKLKSIKDRGEPDRMLEAAGLKGIRIPYRNYSLGMRQRLGIANALMGRPELIILDEPFNGLDPQGVAQLWELLRDWNRCFGTTIVYTSHNAPEDKEGVRFLVLENGRIREV